jgi:hypothetical protein
VSDEAGTSAAPVRLQVVRGNPDDAELAAVLVALASRSQPPRDAADGDHPRGGWGDREARLRLAVHPAPGAWRASGRAGR